MSCRAFAGAVSVIIHVLVGSGTVAAAADAEPGQGLVAWAAQSSTIGQSLVPPRAGVEGPVPLAALAGGAFRWLYRSGLVPTSAERAWARVIEPEIPGVGDWGRPRRPDHAETEPRGNPFAEFLYRFGGILGVGAAVVFFVGAVLRRQRKDRVGDRLVMSSVYSVVIAISAAVLATAMTITTTVVEFVLK